MKGITRKPRVRGPRSAILGLAFAVAALTIGPIQSAGAARWSPGDKISGVSGAGSTIPTWCEVACYGDTYKLNFAVPFTGPWLPSSDGGVGTGLAQYSHKGLSRDFTITCAPFPWSIWWYVWERNVRESPSYPSDPYDWNHFDISFGCTIGIFRDNITGKATFHDSVEWHVRQKQKPPTGIPGEGRDCQKDSSVPEHSGCIFISDPDAPAIDKAGGVFRMVVPLPGSGDLDICKPPLSGSGEWVCDNP